jgi:hypothetical protein
MLLLLLLLLFFPLPMHVLRVLQGRLLPVLLLLLLLLLLPRLSLLLLLPKPLGGRGWDGLDPLLLLQLLLLPVAHLLVLLLLLLLCHSQHGCWLLLLLHATPAQHLAACHAAGTCCCLHARSCRNSQHNQTDSMHGDEGSENCSRQ